MSNPRISNEVLSDKIENLAVQLSRLDGKFDAMIQQYVSRETFDIKIADINHELDELKKSRATHLNWVVPAILYVMGQLTVIWIVKGKL